MVGTNLGKCEWVWEEKLRCLDGSVWIQHGRIQDGCHHQVESEWRSEVFFVQMVGTNLGKCEWVWEEKLRCLDGSVWIQHGRIQDDCHHQVEWEWMSLSQIELVWVRDLYKMAESKMAEMFGCSLCLNAPSMFGQPQCLDAPCTYTTQRKDTLSDKGGVHMPPYIWMPPVHKQHKESMLCQTKGCPYAPIDLDATICLDAPPVCLNATLCLNTPICLDTPVCLDVPICLDTFICLDAHLYFWTYPIYLHSPYVWLPLYVWVPPIFGHPSVWLDIPTCLDTPCKFGCPPYVWLPPVCLDVGIQTYGSVQMY